MRRSRDCRLDSREARSKLPRSDQPYYRNIIPGLYLGYRRGKRGGVWSGRKWTGEKYEKWPIGLADDVVEADDVDVFSFLQADNRLRLGPCGDSDKRIITVNDVMGYYMTQQRAEAKSAKETQYSVDRHITNTIGKTKLTKLSADVIRGWRDNLVDVSMADKKRSGDEKEQRRKRQATANRVLTILKAALNFAEAQGKYKGPAPWKIVKPFKNVDATEHPFLDVETATRLTNCCEPDFRNLVRAALETGCRYGELTAMKVADFNLDAGTVTIRESKSGKTRHSHLTESGLEFFEQATIGKLWSQPIFQHESGEAWKRSQQGRRMRDACKKAKIDPPVPFKALRTTYGSLLALRGVPLQVIAAALGHADTRITEKHYAHLLPNYVAQTIRDNLPTFGKACGNVRRMQYK